ncbi:hypothetical protein IWZ03DRAFT_423611 [Phyllosticta citriasiana]|uniref:AMP-dependent synthetase/ligase domain-containing protein n=1 Tax=Phyllosticta citriasiana TaxID=595635 RepID=A0ABR1KMZ4_9PEZI
MRGGIFGQPHVIDNVKPFFHTMNAQFADLAARVPVENLWTLHYWREEDARRILSNIAKAIIPGDNSRLIVLESILDMTHSSRLARYGDMNMMISVDGVERTWDEWSALADSSGWVITKPSPSNEVIDPLDHVSDRHSDAESATAQWKQEPRSYHHPTSAVSTEQTANPSQAPATDIQVTFIRGGQSTIKYFEAWRLEEVVVMKYAWKKVIRAEPIFQTIFVEVKPRSYMMRLTEMSIPSPDSSRSEATIVLSVHHALLDGFSMERLAEKVRRVAISKQDVKPGKSFLAAARELDAIKKKSEAAAVEFWEKKNSQYGSAASSLGLLKPRKRRAPNRDNEVQADFEHLTNRLQETCRALGVTVASFFHAANLPIDGIGTVIGPLLNSLPLHVEITENASAGDFVRRIFRDLAELSCVHWSTPERGYTRNFEAALSVTRGLQGSSRSSSPSSQDSIHPIRPHRYDFESNVPLSLALDKAAMNLRLVYYPDMYSPETAQDVASCFVGALERLTRRNRQAKNLGVEKDEVVCVHADGSLNWVIGLTGVLKADATICSLDSTLPPDLRSTMFGTAKSKVFIVGDESQLHFRPKDCEHCLVLETLVVAETPATAAAPRVPRPFAPAYLCFTSGSTGRPKGVLCTQQGLVAFQKDVEVRLHAGPGVWVAQFMSPTFDGSVHEILSTLCYSGTLVLRSNANPFQVLRPVDSAIMTPSVARTIAAAEFPNLKTVYLAGEQVPETVVDQWVPGRKLYNMYGAVGEICLAGVQISRRHVDMATATVARFVPADTGCGPPGEMLYRTGDRGYWDDNGKIVCLSRDDGQMKLRGFRVDLDDLEARVLRALLTIKAVALTRVRDSLVAMVQPATLEVETVRAAIKQKLPRQAVPSVIECVDEFPMTRAGKVNLKAKLAG